MKTELARPLLPQDPLDLDVPVTDASNRLERSAVWIFGGAAVIAAASLMYASRHSSFFWDEWWFIVRRRDGSLDDYFRPWNGHLITIPVAIYKLMFEVVGLRSYVPYRALLTVLHLLTCTLLFVYLRRRVTVVYALAASIVVLFLGVGWEDLLWPFQVTYVTSLAAGVGALLLLDRRDRVGDVGAMLAIGVSILSGGIGLLFAGGLVLELLWQRRDRARLWVVLAPLALYGVWYVLDANSSGTNNFEYLEPFTTTLVGNVGRALTGTPLGIAQVLVVAFYVVALIQAVRTWPVTGRFVNTLAMPLAFWTILTYTRGEFPVGSRYAHVGAVMLVLAGAEVLRTWQAPRFASRAVVVVGSVALVLIVANTVAVNLGALSDGAADLRVFARSDRTRLSALALAGDRVDRRAVAFPTVNPLRAGPVLDALSDLDYPVLDRAEILDQAEHARRTADGTLFAALGGADTTPRPLADSDTPLDVAAVDSSVVRDGACVTVTPQAPGAHVTVTGDELAVRVEAGDTPVEMTARSVAAGFAPIHTWSIPPAITLAPGESRDLGVRATGIRPWRLRLRSDAPFRACALR